MTERARSLRRGSPIPERVLWWLMRGRRLAGLKFRRQHVIGPFVADFYCEEARLVVELDGESHVGRGQADAERTAFLESHGLRVLRITNDDLLSVPEAVAIVIAREAGVEFLAPRSDGVGEGSVQRPHPGPLPEGEGDRPRAAGELDA